MHCLIRRCFWVWITHCHFLWETRNRGICMQEISLEKMGDGKWEINFLHFCPNFGKILMIFQSHKIFSACSTFITQAKSQKKTCSQFFQYKIQVSFWIFQNCSVIFTIYGLRFLSFFYRFFLVSREEFNFFSRFSQES